MNPITYQDLHAKLEGLEQSVDSTDLPDFPSSWAIRKPAHGSQIQVVGLDSSTTGKTLPVVVAIGGNYTQAKNSVPRDIKPPASMVEDDLKACRGNLRKGFEHFSQHAPEWVRHCIASSEWAAPTAEQDFHLVMTNFCLWITKDSWQNTGAAIRADLLENNPPLTSGSTVPGEWKHLVSLADSLRETDVIWVGHGIHCEVFALFRQFIRRYRDARWLLMPNLAFPYAYGTWNLLKGRPEQNFA